MSYRGKHRKMSATTRNIARVAVAGVAVGAPVAISAGTANATNWDAVAQCESGGNWSTNTGNGFSGGLQFTPQTWQAYGGTGSPENASREQQIAVAERVKAGQGMGAWPVCGSRGGSSTSYQGSNTQGGGEEQEQSYQAPQKSYTQQKQTYTQKKTYTQPKQEEQTYQAPKQQVQQVAPVQSASKSNPNGDYTVQSGDTASKIAAAKGISLSKLESLNAGYLTNPDLILVGQKLATK